MKKVILIVILSMATIARADFYSLSCRFVSMSTFEQLQTEVLVNCNNGWGLTHLLGLNNSPCKPATNLENFFKGATPNEVVKIIGQTGTNVSLGGLVDGFDISIAKRTGSSSILQAPTIIQHGQPKKCNNTQVAIFRQ